MNIVDRNIIKQLDIIFNKKNFEPKELRKLIIDKMKCQSFKYITLDKKHRLIDIKVNDDIHKIYRRSVIL